MKTSHVMLLVAGLVLVLIVAYFLISPVWRVKILDEALPGLEAATANMTYEEKQAYINSVKNMSGESIEIEEPMPATPRVLRSGDLVPSAHDAKGRAMLVLTEDDLVLRFEDLDTINGPDLRIYLSQSLDISDALDLGPIKATRGNVNYALPSGQDYDQYKYALIWCRAFSVLFSYAELK